MAPSAGLLLAGLLCLLAWARISSWASDPGVSLLVGECGAEWIKVDEPFHLSCRRLGITTATFRKRFEVKAAPKKASLTVHAHKATAAWLDGQLIIDPDRPFEEWRTPLRADLTGLLDPGTHEIRIQVVNRNGLEALLAYSEEAGIK